MDVACYATLEPCCALLSSALPSVHQQQAPSANETMAAGKQRQQNGASVEDYDDIMMMVHVLYPILKTCSTGAHGGDIYIQV